MDGALIAGGAASLRFAVGNLPMLVKAIRTRDLTSYSLAYLVIATIGNALYTVYVISLPIGPVWALHCFYLVTMALMLACYLRFARKGRPERGAASTPAANVDVRRAASGLSAIRRRLAR